MVFHEKIQKFCYNMQGIYIKRGKIMINQMPSNDEGDEGDE